MSTEPSTEPSLLSSTRLSQLHLKSGQRHSLPPTECGTTLTTNMARILPCTGTATRISRGTNSNRQLMRLTLGTMKSLTQDTTSTVQDSAVVPATSLKLSGRDQRGSDVVLLESTSLADTIHQETIEVNSRRTFFRQTQRHRPRLNHRLTLASTQTMEL